MIRLITNNAGMLFAGIVVITLAITLPSTTRDVVWSQRMGAVLVAIGILCLARPSLTGFEIRQTILDENGHSIFSDEHWIAKGKPLPEWVMQQRRNKFSVEVMGPIFTLVGTILTGFGDLITRALVR